MSHTILLDVEAWTGAAVETLRFGTKPFTTAPSDHPANTVYRGLITDPGKMTRQISSGGGTIGDPQASIGSIVLNAVNGGIDAMVDYGFDDRTATMRFVTGDNPRVDLAPVVARFTMAGIDSQNAWSELRLRLRDMLAHLNVPLLTERYAGTSTSHGLGIEGDTDLKDQIKPLVAGSVSQVLAKIVNKADLLYQVSTQPVSSIVVYDGGLPLINYGDRSTLESLMAVEWPNDPNNQYYATCLSLGVFRLERDPVKAITADVVEGATLAQRSASRVARRLLGWIADIDNVEVDEDAFDALHAFNPAEVGIYIDSDAAALSLIGQVLRSIGAAIYPTVAGVITVTPIALPEGEPAAALTIRDMAGQQGDRGDFTLMKAPDADGDGVPAYRIVLNWGMVWNPQNAGELAGAVSLDFRTYLGITQRQAVAEDASVRIAHPHAPVLTIDTLLTQEADALNEAARLLAIYKARRDYVRITVPDEIVDGVDLGSVVSLDLRLPNRPQNPRFGYAGKLFRVIGHAYDFGARRVDLTLWG